MLSFTFLPDFNLLVPFSPMPALFILKFCRLSYFNWLSCLLTCLACPVYFLTFCCYQQQINENYLSKHPVPLANSLYVCIINTKRRHFLERFYYLPQPQRVAMRRLVFSREAVTCWHLSADWSANETMTNGRCLRIWRSGHGQEEMTETGENYLLKNSIIYVLGQILGRWSEELWEGLVIKHAKGDDKCTGIMRRAGRVARQGKWDVYRKFQSRKICDWSQWYRVLMVR
jgi:hypothetical protein